MKNILYTLLILLFGFCSKSGTNNDTPPLSEIVESGWNYFTAGNYSDAVNKFTNAIEEYGDDAFEAYNGRGWSYARIAFGRNDEYYNSSLLDFEKAISLKSDLADAKTGVSFVYLVKNEYSKAINMAENVLENFPDYEFKYDTSVNSIDLRVLLAQALFYTGAYAEAAEQMDILEPGVNHPANDYETLAAQIQSISLNF